jgi:hypothetical protein
VAFPLYRQTEKGIAMTGDDEQKLGVLARAVLAALILLIIGGIAWHGITTRIILRIWHNLLDRPSRPMAFRFILQPLMAAIAAILHGRSDARTGRTPYFWTLMSKPQERIGRLREGLNASARIILLGVVMDAIYQIIVLESFYPVESVIVAVVLGFVPYLVLRGIVTRVPLEWHGNNSPRRV